MEFLRYSRDAWGQTVLEGMSWDLFWYFVGAGGAFILLHMVYMRLVNQKKGHE
ncbi:MAG: hypothetical protein HOH43_15145 [Candidatus Latescibacteria bacterium]|jgi:hypothetical protein|nr:hypothetical protein [Candidatus Latescibacterota bacterium]